MKIRSLIVVLLTITVGGWWGLKILPVKKEKLQVTKVKSQQKEVKKPTIQILFGGDVMLDRHIRMAARKRGGYVFILAGMKDWLNSYDVVVVNLEGPITNYRSVSVGSKPGGKGNYTFTFEPKTASFLLKHNMRLVNLGNNHILNFGIRGLDQTLKFLTQNQVDYFGQPNNNKRWQIKDFNGFKIGFINYNQFVKEGKFYVFKDLKQVKPKVDWVVLYAHWGEEYKLKANKQIMALAHEFVDKGVDTVIGSHPHVVQNWEDYKGKRIYYSLGNFIFDQYFSNQVRQGLLVGMVIERQTKKARYSHYWIKLLPTGETNLKTKH